MTIIRFAILYQPFLRRWNLEILCYKKNNRPSFEKSTKVERENKSTWAVEKRNIIFERKYYEDQK